MSGEKRGHKIPKSESKNFGERYIPCDDLIVVAQHQDEELWEAPWYKNVRFKLITPEELPDISSFKRRISAIYIAQRFYETYPNIRANSKYISLHRGCEILNSIKRILKDMYDDCEPLAKKSL
ncbi:1220_t:CDS:2 [Gigaspora margarita]|uniref:1220_t:CDS:1 n=1 Tax=Gigaspora margarita TaxID=4874 RepID=A0ABN7UQE4_GIGMA|nr:1220_t:CDS:2 [Gigaspora margarita]